MRGKVLMRLTVPVREAVISTLGSLLLTWARARSSQKAEKGQQHLPVMGTCC